MTVAAPGVWPGLGGSSWGFEPSHHVLVVTHADTPTSKPTICSVLGSLAGSGRPTPCLVGDPQRLDLAGNEPTDGSMPTDSDTTHTRHLQTTTSHPEAIPVLFEADAMEAMAAFETGITRCLTLLDPPTEGLKGLVAIGCDHLQDGAVNDLCLWQGLFVVLDSPHLLGFAHTSFFKLPRPFALFDTHVVEVPSTLPEMTLLALAGIQAILVGLEHHFPAKLWLKP